MPVLEEEVVCREENGAEHGEADSENYPGTGNFSVRLDYNWTIAGADCAHETSLEINKIVDTFPGLPNPNIPKQLHQKCSD